MDFNLQRFVQAQEGIYEQVVQELRQGHKQSHWMWFIFPQLLGLGRSPTADFYAIISLAEARAYLHHPILGPRYHECLTILSCLQGLSAETIFGYPDVRKFHSSLTLFMQVEQLAIYQELLDKYYDGCVDQATIQLLASLPALD